MPAANLSIGSGTLALAAGSSVTCIPTSAHATGAVGTNWRTDIEVHNPGATQASYAIALLKHGMSNPTPTSQSFSLTPGQSVRYADVVFERFAFSGKAALRVTATAGTILVTSRTFNDLQASGTFGQFVPAFPDSEAITSADEGRLIQLSHQPNAAAGGFRTNLGVVNATAGTLAVTVDLYKADGTRLGQVPLSLRPYDYQQVDKVFELVTQSAVADGFAILRTSTSGGRFFAYASVIDNRTSDPIFIPAMKTVPQAGPVVVGPGGTSVVLPSGGTTPNAPVTLTTGNGADLPKAGEALVSPVIRVNVGGEGASTGAGPYLVRIPVTGAVSDPEKLLLKVQTSVGPVYPVAGVYDAGSKVFTAEVEQLWDGWNMGLVTNPNLEVLADTSAEAGTLGWVTPDDWQTCAWKVVKLASSAPLSFRTEVTQALGPACEHLRNARFRSPKLWMDGRWPPKMRIAWLVQGLGRTDSKTSFCSSRKEDKATFSMVGFNDEQMQALGQLYFNWDEYQLVSVQLGLTVKSTVIHELFHAVQSGYDIRGKWWETKDLNNKDVKNDTRLWFKEGTAALVGMTYQTNPNGLYGGTVTVRDVDPPESLSEVLQYWEGSEAYARQDFFAYFAARNNGGAFLNLRNLFQDLADFTHMQFDKGDEEYRTLYRRAMDKHYSEAFDVTLPDLYTNFAVDRAYRHTNPAILRVSDLLLAPNSLDRTLFDHIDDSGTRFNHVTDWDPATTPFVTEVTAGHTAGLKPLQTWAVKVTVPAGAKAAGTLQIPITVSGAPLSHQGVRVFIFRESNGVMVPGGETEVTNISQPVNVPVSASIQTLTILVVNGSVESTPANVRLGTQSFTRFSLGLSEVHICYEANCATGESCSESGDGTFVGPLTWNGNVFSYVFQGIRWEGELSGDGKTVLYFRNWVPGRLEIDWRNLPLIPGRSTADISVFGASGEAARSHIVTWVICERQVVIDWTKPVVAEVWLGN